MEKRLLKEFERVRYSDDRPPPYCIVFQPRKVPAFIVMSIQLNN